MKPILKKGHERPLTYLKYNREGDLLFSCAKDDVPSVRFDDDGERLGTYRGHNGAVWCCDQWDVQSGTQLFSFAFDTPARDVEFAVGDKLAVITTDPFMHILTSCIHVKTISSDPDEQTGDSVLTINGPRGRTTKVVWGPLNKTIISADEDTIVRIWDSERGKLLNESSRETGHSKTITSLSMSEDGSHFLTGSLDRSDILWKSGHWELSRLMLGNKRRTTLSPLFEHVVIGGGQDAWAVTRTIWRGKSEGYFGPINALAFNPDGRSFSSGGEDGYVRLHHFDQDYFNDTM
ncbi:hypothetical protein MKX01_022628 [Papaver californicum]|nr:hypothetical protein MKX01_022628 [Papaver californicum]